MKKSGTIISNTELQPGYRKIRFHAPEIAEKAKAGHFVQVKIAHLRDRILRRPFSIFDVSDTTVDVVYKIVGEGTNVLAELAPGVVCDLLGPLGNSFTPPRIDEIPVVIGGGYGAAAMYMLTRYGRGVLLLGARTKSDLILMDEYARAGFEVRSATDDGTAGFMGRVTELLPGVLEDFAGCKLRFYGCGPTPMLMALARILPELGYPKAELSLDQVMCCGVGACFSCVVKVRDDSETRWRYARSCHEGPVFPADQIYWEEE